MKTLAVCVLGTCISIASCGGIGDKQLPRGDAGEAGESESGGNASTTGGSLGTGGGGKASGGTTAGHEGGEGSLGGGSSGGADTTGQGGDASGAAGAPSGVSGASGNEGGTTGSGGGAAGSEGGATDNEGGATGNGGGAGGSEGGATNCEVGEAQSPAAPGSLDLFGQIAYFGSGGELPAGHYRVTYLDGCMKYASAQDWAIHAYGDGSIAWWLGSASGNKLVLLPGTVGIFQGQGGYTDFEACVAANLLLPAIEFDFAGGVLGVWLADSNYGDNVSGVEGRNPVWKLTLLDSVCE